MPILDPLVDVDHLNILESSKFRSAAVVELLKKTIKKKGSRL